MKKLIGITIISMHTLKMVSENLSVGEQLGNFRSILMSLHKSTNSYSCYTYFPLKSEQIVGWNMLIKMV